MYPQLGLPSGSPITFGEENVPWQAAPFSWGSRGDMHGGEGSSASAEGPGHPHHRAWSTAMRSTRPTPMFQSTIHAQTHE